MKDVALNQKEQARLSVLNSVLEFQVPIADAAELLGVTPRHVRRMLAAYRDRSAAALSHGNRGRRPHNATSPCEAAAVVQLATERYEGANHTHLTELLSEREPAHGAAHSHQGRHRQSSQPARTAAPFSPPADAPGGDAGATGR